MKIIDVIAGLVARALPTKSVDTIVSFVTKAIARLAAAEAAETARAEALTKQAADLTKAAEAASREAGRASALRANLTALTHVSA